MKAFFQESHSGDGPWSYLLRAQSGQTDITCHIGISTHSYKYEYTLHPTCSKSSTHMKRTSMSLARTRSTIRLSQSHALHLMRGSTGFVTRRARHSTGSSLDGAARRRTARAHTRTRTHTHTHTHGDGVNDKQPARPVRPRRAVRKTRVGRG